jgi:hypothetical protein
LAFKFVFISHLKQRLSLIFNEINECASTVAQLSKLIAHPVFCEMVSGCNKFRFPVKLNLLYFSLSCYVSCHVSCHVFYNFCRTSRQYSSKLRMITMQTQQTKSAVDKIEVPSILSVIIFWKVQFSFFHLLHFDNKTIDFIICIFQLDLV